MAADAWKTARNEREQFQALGALRGLEGRLPADSKLRGRAKKLAAEAEKRVGCQLAYKAKATASGSDKNDTPAKAVDGELTTRWSASGPGQKWLALDLGSPKSVSRWVLRAAASVERKPDQNLSDFKLQRSDDGSQWLDVDSVVANRADVIDRVVAPFSARHVRILVLKDGRKPNEKTARIQELALGDAGEQARTQYDAGQNVALRFSTATEFVSGPVGEPGAMGGAEFNEAARSFSVKGSGGDIGGKADDFHFVWQPVAGDCEIVARVESLQAPNPMAKAGLMIRADFAKDAACGGLFLQPAGKMQFVKRKAGGAQAAQVNKPGISQPRWLKLKREGAAVIGFESADGQNWTEVGRETLGGIEETAFVGLAVCAHAKGQLATARFSGVEVRKTKP
jgi:F5/8 type C domain